MSDTGIQKGFVAAGSPSPIATSWAGVYGSDVERHLGRGEVRIFSQHESYHIFLKLSREGSLHKPGPKPGPLPVFREV